MRGLLLGEQLDQIGLHLDGGRQKVGQLDEQAAELRAAQSEQMSFVSVERAADDAHTGTVHGGRDLFGTVVAGSGRTLHGADETLHVVIGDGHRLAEAAVQIAILQGVGLGDDRIELLARVAHEEQIVDEGNLDPDAASLLGDEAGDERCKDLELLPGEEFVGRELGVAAREVAQDEPADGVIGGCGIHR